MKNLIRIVTLLLFALSARGQCYDTVLLAGGSQTYGTTFDSVPVTLTTTGTVGLTSAWCYNAATHTGVYPYYIGFSGLPGTGFTFSFGRSVAHVKILVAAMDSVSGVGHETDYVYINGSPYYLTPANLSPLILPACTGAPSVSIVGGAIQALTPTGGTGDQGVITISDCIYSIGIFTNNITGSAGNEFTLLIDTCTVGGCFGASANTACVGDTLFLNAIGDSLSATYLWSGPGITLATSTMRDPVIAPIVYGDSGLYTVYRTIGGITTDTASIFVHVYPSPVIGLYTNAPLCPGLFDTLKIADTNFATSVSYYWEKPPTNTFFTSSDSVIIPNFGYADTGVYTLIVTTGAGCTDTARLDVRIVLPPGPPLITGDSVYCQDSGFVPFVVLGDSTGAFNWWYPTATSVTRSTTPTAINTAIVGYYTVYATQALGSCESAKDSFKVRVVHSPLAPGVTGTMAYCQGVGPVVPLNVITYVGPDTVLWETSLTGPLSFTQPVPNINVVPPSGAYTYYAFITDSGCRSPIDTVHITIHHKPNPPSVTNETYCQFWSPAPINFAFDGTDPPETIQQYGPGITPPGSSGVVYPPTSVAPDTMYYFLTETSTYGCVSDSATEKIVILPKPLPPIITDPRYCQHAAAAPLNFDVDSAYNADSIAFYINGVQQRPTPVPPTDTTPGYMTWYVLQSVRGCRSDSIPLTVQVVYVPQFSIAGQNWVCQYDSITLAYDQAPGLPLFEPFYYWILPEGASAGTGFTVVDSMLTVRFDSANQNHFPVVLRASDDSNFCHAFDTLLVTVVPRPNMTISTKNEVCLNDTVQLALVSRTTNAFTYQWHVDDTTLASSTALNIVTANSNTGGPYLISWSDTGEHVIKVTTATVQGCPSLATYDSVNVHNIPDASFQAMGTGSFCLGDSIQFSANTSNYAYSYASSPTDFFSENNQPVIWGTIRAMNAIITLTVTDPYGCYATRNTEVFPQTCCTLVFPNAFAPEASGGTAAQKDRTFYPISQGHHIFHEFRIVNRWGQTVFDAANNADAQWDGTFNGVPQDMGVYYYYIKYDCNGTTMEQKGDVTLIR